VLPEVLICMDAPPLPSPAPPDTSLELPLPDLGRLDDLRLVRLPRGVLLVTDDVGSPLTRVDR